MKITATEEYGIRVLIRIASADQEHGMSIPQLKEAEGLSEPHVAKLCRVLRMAGIIKSTPGAKGGYVLGRPAQEIVLQDVLVALGGKLYDQRFCDAHTGIANLCTHSVDCATRSLWRMVQFSVESLLVRLTLQDLLMQEKEAGLKMEHILQRNVAQLLTDSK
ncbi:MAG: RrF2 family transcriptional regulator [Chitinophagaceae bacterium]